MATPASIRQLKDHIGQDVLLQGWLYNRRSKGKLHFLEVRDGSGIVQAVMGKQDVPEDIFELAGRCAQEASIKVTGKVVADERAKGGVELQATGFELVAAPT
ncbi:MAG: OB-fold nucleic acid binding domain-containing protein, partial [Planctomycetota bacterium]